MPPGELHVWVARTADGLGGPEAMSCPLAADELAQAARLHLSAHRDRFLARRRFRRLVLGLYAGMEPGQLRFGRGRQGKPVLVGDGLDRLSFNETESEGVAIMAVALGRRVGVDVERVRSVEDAEGIVERFASAREKADFTRLCPEERQAGFLRWWTAKEAYVKALGEGLFHPLDDFSVSIQLDQPLRLLAPSKSWWLESLQPSPGYLGAVAVEGEPGRLSLKSWP